MKRILYAVAVLAAVLFVAVGCRVLMSLVVEVATGVKWPWFLF